MSNQFVKRTYSITPGQAQELLNEINRDPSYLASQRYPQTISICKDAYCRPMSNPNGSRATLFHGQKVSALQLNQLKTRVIAYLKSIKPVECASHHRVEHQVDPLLLSVKVLMNGQIDTIE